MISFDFNCEKLELESKTEQFGRFTMSPLGFGSATTIGTILRRTLLTEIFGLRIIGVRIAGINNEFGVIPGVKEDVLEILLNLKEIAFVSEIKNYQGQLVCHIRIKGPAVITAGCFLLDSGIRVVNPAHYIATISKNSALVLEAHLGWGKGYRLAEHQKPIGNSNTLDYLKLDSNFVPILRVNYNIDYITKKPTSTNKKEIHEKLIFEIWTNGSIAPDEALAQATDFIINWFKVLQNAQSFNIRKFEKPKQEKEFYNNELKQILEFDINKDESLKEKSFVAIPIEQLNISVRALNALKGANIHFVHDFENYSIENLKKIKNFGKKSLQEVVTILEEKFKILLR